MGLGHLFSRAESFVSILHSSIRSALEKGRDESIKNEALQRESGWMHVNGAYCRPWHCCGGRH